MTVRGRIGVFVACGVVALVVALYAAWRSPPATPLPPAGSVRLGPDAGEEVATYLAALPVPAAGVAPALVQFTAEQRPDGAVALGAGGTIATAVFRVPLPRVQTALRFEALDPGAPPDVALDTARQRAASAASADATRLTGRPRDVAAAEAAGAGGSGLRLRGRARRPGRRRSAALDRRPARRARRGRRSAGDGRPGAGALPAAPRAGRTCRSGPRRRPGAAVVSRIVTSSGSTHTGGTTTPDLRDSPTMYWVVILMSLSVGRWHRGGMTMFGGNDAAGAGPSHVPIVIGASPELRPPGWVERVVYAAVMPIQLLTARVVRPGVDPAQSLSAQDCADFGRGA